MYLVYYVSLDIIPKWWTAPYLTKLKCRQIIWIMYLIMTHCIHNEWVEATSNFFPEIKIANIVASIIQNLINRCTLIGETVAAFRSKTSWRHDLITYSQACHIRNAYYCNCNLMHVRRDYHSLVTDKYSLILHYNIRTSIYL